MLYPISEPIPDSIENRCGYINYEGNIVVPLIYGARSHFFEGKALLIDSSEKAGFIDRKGKLVIPHRFKDVEDSIMESVSPLADT